MQCPPPNQGRHERPANHSLYWAEEKPAKSPAAVHEHPPFARAEAIERALEKRVQSSCSGEDHIEASPNSQRSRQIPARSVESLILMLIRHRANGQWKKKTGSGPSLLRLKSFDFKLPETQALQLALDLLCVAQDENEQILIGEEIPGCGISFLQGHGITFLLVGIDVIGG